MQQLAAPCPQLKLSYGCSVVLPNNLDVATVQKSACACAVLYTLR